MTEPTEHEIHVVSRLLYLFDRTCKDYPDWDGDDIKEYIDVREWGLAADSLAYDYLAYKFVVSASIYNIFADLAKRMKLLNYDFFPSIKLLLENPPHDNVQSK